MSRTFVRLPVSKATLQELADKMRLSGQSDRITPHGSVDLSDVMVSPVHDERDRLWEQSIGYDAELETKKQIIMQILSTDTGGNNAHTYEDAAVAILKALGL